MLDVTVDPFVSGVPTTDFQSVYGSSNIPLALIVFGTSSKIVVVESWRLPNSICDNGFEILADSLDFTAFLWCRNNYYLFILS
jgi:hypothetical protein